LDVTLKVTVQLPAAGIVIPLKLRLVAPPVKVVGVVPAQVPPTAPVTALMLVKVSVNAPPVSTNVLVLDKVRVTVELLPCGMVDGLKALEMTGVPFTVRVALLLGGPATGV